jgi:preprotein translocase subunit Sec61beta
MKLTPRDITIIMFVALAVSVIWSLAHLLLTILL